MLPADTNVGGALVVEGLHAALQPAFLSQQATSQNKRAMLAYFYRERSAMIP